MIKDFVFTSASFKEQRIQLYDNLAIIIGPANSGKTQILDHLAASLQGKGVKSLYDSQVVNYGEFEVLYIEDHISLDEAIKVNKTASIKRYLLSYINDTLIHHPQFNSFTEHFDQFKSLLNDMVNERLFADIYENKKVKLKANIFDVDFERYLEKLITINVVENDAVIDPDRYSKIALKEVWFQLLLKTRITTDNNKKVVLIDQPDLYGGPSEWKKWGHWIDEARKKDYKIIISIMNPYFCQYLNCDIAGLNIINENQIININASPLIKSFITLSSYLSNENRTGLSLTELRQQLPTVIDKNDLITERIWINKQIPFLINTLLLNEWNNWNQLNSRQQGLKLLWGRLLKANLIAEENSKINKILWEI